MANKIVDIDPEKRATREALQAFKIALEAVKPEDIKGAFFYLQTGQGEPTMAVYGPDWQLTGRVKEFLNEINLELYLSDFGEHDLMSGVGEEEEE